MQLKLKNKDVNIKLIELYVIYKLKKIFLFTGENRIKLKHENLNTLSKKKTNTERQDFISYRYRLFPPKTGYR